MTRKKNHKFVAILFLFTFLFFFFSFTDQDYIIVKDMMGNDIKIKKEIKSVITLDPFSTQIMISLSLTDLVLDAQYGTNLIGKGFERVAPQYKNWGSSFSGNNLIFENIAAKKPDLIISQIGRGGLDKLKEMGFSVFIVDVETPSNFLKSVQEVATLFGKQKEAKEINALVEEDLNSFEGTKETFSAKIYPEKPKIYIAGSNILRTFGKSSIQSYLIGLSGGKSVADTYNQTKVDINPETLIGMNPDIILLSSYTAEKKEQILQDSRFSSINAVKNRQIYTIPSFIVSWDLPSFEIVGGICFIRNIILKNIYLDTYIVLLQKLYSKVYALNLSKDEISSLLLVAK